MTMKHLLTILLSFYTTLTIFAQTASLSGKVYDQLNNEPIPFANVVIQNTKFATTTDNNGNYNFSNLQPALYNITASFIGYKNNTIYEVQLTNARPTIIDIPLETTVEELKTVEIKAEPFRKSEESPISLRTIGVNEIKRNPGGNRDISRAIQTLPGVASTPSFRNDILIRGGAPAENRFFIDGIEIPVINHFSTQGSSGGPVGIINVDFVNDLEFYSGAFPATRGNALSSVFDFRFKEGNRERINTNLTLSGTDIGATLEGPINKKTTFILSARRSYLQFLFQALQLPILPTYNGFQFKIKHNINQKNTLTILGIGAIDQFKLNDNLPTAQETDSITAEYNQYIYNQLPINNQWNYTIGAKYTNFRKNSYTNIIISRTHLNNRAYKYQNNDQTDPNKLLLDYKSQEIENKLRIEDITRLPNNIKLTIGGGTELAKYLNNTYQKISIQDSILLIDYNNSFNLLKYHAFAQISKAFLKDRLSASLGIRLDANTYSNTMTNPLQQASPRLSLSYNITPQFTLNFNTGIYYQLPAYTILGYTQNNQLINKNNNLKYIRAAHIVAGAAYNTKNNLRISLEAYYKKYTQYPFSTQKQISLANLGADFGVIGNEPVTSTSDGRTYGIELLAQQKLFKGFYGIIAYTIGYSQFKEVNQQYAPSSWDARHIISLTAGKKFKKNWELGTRWRFSSGLPFTPYNEQLTALIPVWNINNSPVLDYTQLNDQRTKPFHTLDTRVDKKWFFKRWSLNLFLDIQNIYGFKTKSQDILNVARDNNNQPIIDPNDPTRYILKKIPNEQGTTLPTIGIIVEL